MLQEGARVQNRNMVDHGDTQPLLADLNKEESLTSAGKKPSDEFSTKLNS